MVESRVPDGGPRIRFTRWQRWRWPLGIAAVIALTWAPVAIVLCNYLPLPAAPSHGLTFMTWCHLLFAKDQMTGYLCGVGPLAVSVNVLLWLARRRRYCCEPLALVLGRFEAELTNAADWVARRGLALVLGSWALAALIFSVSLGLGWDCEWLWCPPMLLHLLTLFVVPVAASTRWSPRQWAGAAALAGVLYLSGAVQLNVTCWAERRAYRAMAARAEPLCRALDRYTADHGYAPERLEALVPAYLPRIPRTGWSRAPRFEYQLIVTRGTWKTHRGQARMDFDPAGKRLSIYPVDPGSLREALADYGQPVTAQIRRHWQLRVPLPDRSFDSASLVTEDGWHNRDHGRWSYAIH